MQWLRGILLLLIVSPAVGCRPREDHPGATFPSKPIKLIVYTKPAGPIDQTARKFAQIAKKYTDATFVVENKPGAGGIVAMEKVLQLPADGHTLLAVTKSNIAKIVFSHRESYIDQLDWIAMLVADPECVIVRNDTGIASWKALIANARENPGHQIWIGPAIGGLDHVTALKIWDELEISAIWLPYASGGEAKAALLGDQGVAYVGNPGEADPYPNLDVAALSSPSRISQFPEVPTFKELGLKGLDQEYMWRGFAIKKGTPREALAWYDKLFRQVTNDREWRDYWEKSGINVRYGQSNEFTPVVIQDKDDFQHYLNKIGIVQSGEVFTRSRRMANWLVLGLVMANGAFAYWLIGYGPRERAGHFLIPAFFLAVSILFFTMTWYFPRSGPVGPAAVPRLWIGILVPLSVYLFILAVRNRTGPVVWGERPGLVIQFVLVLTLYVAAMDYLGYFVSSFALLVATMYLLGLRRVGVMLGVSAGWLFVSYWVFVRLLQVTLPMGRWLE